MIGRMQPVLMHASEVVSIKTAAFICRRSEKSIRRLCAKYGLARQTTRSAPLEISRVGLEMAMHGDHEAIELLRAGRRDDPRVARYLAHLELSTAS